MKNTEKLIGELREKVKELEAKLEFQKFGDLDNIEFEEYMNQFIPKQAVIDKIEELKKQRRELGFKTYLRKEDIINDDREIVIKIQILQELLQEEDK